MKTNMRSYRLPIIGFIAAAALSGAWIAITWPYFAALDAGELPPEKAFDALFLVGSGYYSAVEYMLFFPLPALFAFEFAMPREKAHVIVRNQTPSKSFKKRLATLLSVTLLCAVIYEAIGATFIFARFDPIMIVQWRFPEYVAFNLIIVLIHFFRIGLLYYLLKDLTKKPLIAMGLLICAYWFEYQIGKWGNVNWIPNGDFVYGYKILQSEVQTPDIALAVFRQALLTALVIVIARVIYMRKDFLRDEK